MRTEAGVSEKRAKGPGFRFGQAVRSSWDLLRVTYIPDQSFLLPKASHSRAAVTETTKSTSIVFTSRGLPTL
jgi:hypothetical protein